MHHKLEIVMPETDDIETAVETAMSEFCEHDEDHGYKFYDWYQLGGRFSGSKIEARVGREVIDAFHEWLNDEGVTVSGIQCGKQALKPESQIPRVDEKWAEMTGLSGPCTLFQHSGQQGLLDGDICTIADLPNGYAACHVIVCKAEGKPVYMVEDRMWNGVNFVDSGWNGHVQTAIDMANERSKHYKEEYRKERTPDDTWIVITVDYHS